MREWNLTSGNWAMRTFQFVKTQGRLQIHSFSNSQICMYKGQILERSYNKQYNNRAVLDLHSANATVIITSHDNNNITKKDF